MKNQPEKTSLPQKFRPLMYTLFGMLVGGCILFIISMATHNSVLWYIFTAIMIVLALITLPLAITMLITSIRAAKK